MRESWGSTKPKGAMKVKEVLGASRVGWLPRGGSHYWPVLIVTSMRRSESVHVGTRKMVNYA